MRLTPPSAPSFFRSEDALNQMAVPPLSTPPPPPVLCPVISEVFSHADTLTDFVACTEFVLISCRCFRLTSCLCLSPYLQHLLDFLPPPIGHAPPTAWGSTHRQTLWSVAVISNINIFLHSVLSHQLDVNKLIPEQCRCWPLIPVCQTDLWSVQQDETSDEGEQNRKRSSNSAPKSLREADTLKQVKLQLQIYKNSCISN